MGMVKRTGSVEARLEAVTAQTSPSFCLTVHKAQGSEFSSVVYAELLYSAVTRAKHQLILMGLPQAYQMAAKKQDGVMRYSGLFRRPQILTIPS